RFAGGWWSIVSKTTSGPGHSRARPTLEVLEDRLVLDGTIIEDFGSGGLSAYTTVLRFSPFAEVSPGAGPPRGNCLLKHGGYEWLIRNDDGVQVGQGQTLSVWTRFAGTADGRAYFGFGARPPNFNDFLNTGGMLSLVAAPNTGQLLLQQNRGFQHVTLGAAKQEYVADHWYRMEVTWVVGGNLTGKLFDSDGSTLLQTVTGSSTAFSSGGIAFRAFGGDKYFDSVTLDSGQHPSGTHALLSPARVQRSYLGGGAGNGPQGIPNPFQYVSVPDTGIDIQLR